MIDQTLAHFRITAKLGEGGMGTVYRATDSKLGRDVALKFLPETFAADAERMARFTREAQLLAALNHPNVAGIHSVEEARDPSGRTVRFLVMELVEGQTLQERIDRGPLPLDEALQVALQIAAGLEEAHERGIVHRDLKPANVKLTPGGQVKILDFGLAKAFDPDAGEASAAPGGSGQRLSLSPTLTGTATQAGMLLGTAAYMAPEQARGAPADRRADIWALGVVLMEMLTGKAVHRGNTVSDTLASVLARDPSWDELPGDTPGPIRRLLGRCLEKDNRMRLRDVGEARIAIDRFLADPHAHEAETAVVAPAAAPAWKRALPWVATAVLAAALVLTVLVSPSGPAGPAKPVRLNLSLPLETQLFTGFGASAVLSPDGSRIAYVLSEGSRNELRVQALDQWEGSTLIDAEGSLRPYQPFYSPDGQWIGFVTPTELRKVPLSGGTPIKLCEADRPRGATWGPDGTIVFAPSPGSGLMQVPAAGGEPRPFTELDQEQDEATHRWPQWLPGGRTVLFTSHTRLSGFDEANIEIFVPAEGERRVVHHGGSHGRYVDAGGGTGYLVYANAGSLFAAPFDPRRLELTGSAAPVVEGVTSGAEGSAQFSTSADGRLVYASGTAGVAGHTVVWVDRAGRIEPLWDEERVYRNPAFSPDGRSLAVDILAEGQFDLWVYDIDREVPTRLTFSDGNDTRPVWSPDGEQIYYAKELDGATGIYRKRADGSADPEQVLTDDAADLFPGSFSPDGKLLVFSRVTSGNPDIGLVRLDEEAEPQMFQATSFIEINPALSPDGRWLAYVSNESGQFEIYVRPVEGRGKWQISSAGGFLPNWSPDGRELLFWFGSKLFRAEVDTASGAFRAGRAEELAEAPILDVGNAREATLAPDGNRFAAFHSKAAASPDTHQHLQIVLNWADELRARFGE